MTLRHSLLLIEQNRYNSLVRLSNMLWRERAHNPDFLRDAKEIDAKMVDSMQRIKELSA